MFLTTHADSIIDVSENTDERERNAGFTKTLGFVVRDGLSRRYVSVGVTPEQLEGLKAALGDPAELARLRADVQGLEDAYADICRVRERLDNVILDYRKYHREHCQCGRDDCPMCF